MEVAFDGRLEKIRPEINRLGEELRESMMEKDWHKAMEIADKMDLISQSIVRYPDRNPLYVCKSYDEDAGGCAGRLYFKFLPEMPEAVECPFYGEGCKIKGSITSYIFGGFDAIGRNKENFMGAIPI